MAKRLAFAPIVLLLLFTITFVMVRLAPGGPFDDERDLPPEVLQKRQAEFLLDRPLPVQYLHRLKRICFHFDFGTSMKHQNRQVSEIILTHIKPSLILGAAAIIISLWIGILAGIISALKANSLIDYSAMGLTAIGISLPTFVFGPLLQLLFAMKLGWLPVLGLPDYDLSTLTNADALKKLTLHLILPALTLSLPFAARYARLMRAGMLEVLSEDFIRTARAKGIPERTIVFRHALRGGILPVISFSGPAFAGVLTGSLVIEQIFTIPGLGVEFINSATTRDYTLVMGTTLIYGAFIIFFNLLADLMYVLLDPRVRDA